MNPIKLLDPNSSGTEVADLHAALVALLERSVFTLSPAIRRYAASFGRERAGQHYGEATRVYVELYQRSTGIAASGVVDRATAEAINTWLRTEGLLDVDREIVVRGNARYADRSAAANVSITIARSVRPSSTPLATVRSTADGTYSLRARVAAIPRAVVVVVTAIDDAGAVLVSSGEVKVPRDEVVIDLELPMPTLLPNQTVEGRLLLI